MSNVLKKMHTDLVEDLREIRQFPMIEENRRLVSDSHGVQVHLVVTKDEDCFIDPEEDTITHSEFLEALKSAEELP